MTPEQFDIAARLANLSPLLDRAARTVILHNATLEQAAREHQVNCEQLRKAISAVERSVLEIRGAFVVHSANAFRITVSHSDFHRMPGSLQLELGQVVRLIHRTSERLILVRVVRLPERPVDYFEGIVLKQQASGSRFAVGDRVRFSEDQVELPPDQATKRPYRVSRRRLARIA